MIAVLVPYAGCDTLESLATNHKSLTYIGCWEQPSEGETEAGEIFRKKFRMSGN